MTFDYPHLATLAAILRTGSFEAAAHELGVTQSAVSQRLKALEERVGTLLVYRAQPCTGTDIGNRLAAHAEHVAAMDQQIAGQLRDLAPNKGARLRIAVNADSLATWFLGPLASVDGQFFDLILDDQAFSSDLLRKGEVAAAVTAQDDTIVGCDSRYLGKLRYLATASPAFCATHLPDGATPEALAAAPMLRFNTKDDLQLAWLRQYVGPDIYPPFHSLASSQGFVDASLLGMGWGMNPEIMVREHIKAGRLVEILPNSGYDTPLYWQTSRLLGPALAKLTKAICHTASKSLPQ